MLKHLRPEHIAWLLFIIAMLIIAFSVARASEVRMGCMSDDIEIPDWWQPYEYNPNIPLRDSLQCILWDTCHEYDVPVDYVLAIIQTESGFLDNADSGVAHGLMQLHKAYYSPDLPPGENIIEGVKLLRSHYDRYGNWPAAITAYAVGHDNGSRWYWGIIAARAEKWRAVL